MKGPHTIDVDLSALSALDHQCSGCNRIDTCCCAVHEVCVTAREMKTIIGALPLAAKYCPSLKEAQAFNNVFDEVERGLFAIDTHEDGLCVFAYRSKSAIRCSLHSVSLQLGKSPHLLKPASCMLWPLVLREPPHAALSICDDALRFPCNKPNTAKKGAISPEILESIEKLLGASACGQIQKAAKSGRKHMRIPMVHISSLTLSR